MRSEPYGSSYWIDLPTTQLLSRFMRYGWVTNNASDAIDVFRQGQILHFTFTLALALLGGMLAAWIGSRTAPKH